MPKTVRAVLIGAAHMHVLYLARQCLNNPGVELLGIADTPPLRKEPAQTPPFTRPWNLDYVTNRLGVAKYDDWRAMLDEVRPDLAIVATETPLHAEVFEACAALGIATSVEKPMAVSYAEGLKMARVAERTGATLLVNWPLAWQPCMGQLKELIAGGRLGRLLRIHQLVAHPGPLGRGVRHPMVEETSDATTDGEKAGTWWHTAALGGGAMLDFCCYGAMASNYLIGRPATAAMGMRLNSMHPLGDADDNAAMIVRYPDCMAVLEGSWTVPAGAAPPAPTLYGTEGMAECASVADGVQITVRDFHGHSEQLPVLAPEEHLRDITTAFVHHVLTGEPMPEVLDVKHNLEALAILDAGLRSAESGRMELVPTRAWAIGG